MMNAKEMFEELGYEKALDELDRMAYGDCMGDEHIARIHSRKILQELVEKNERLVAHVKLAIKMLEENSPYAIETLKEVIEQDWRGENYE